MRPQEPQPAGRSRHDQRMADLLTALSLAADLALGLPAEHATRSCWIAMQVAGQLRLPAEQRGDLYYASLLMDAGCTAWTSRWAAAIQGDELAARRDLFFFRDPRDPLEVMDWLRRFVAVDAPLPVRTRRMLDFALHGRAFMQEGFQTTCEVANRFALRLGMPKTVQEALLHVFEQYDGKGMPSGIRGDAIPLCARIMHLCMFMEVTHRTDGKEAARRLARRRRATAFDPQVVDAFLTLSERQEFWEALEEGSLLETVRLLEPQSPGRMLPHTRLLDAAYLAADFADMKSSYTLGHSRRVADLAVTLSQRLSLSSLQTETIYMAALMHDLGVVAVPTFILEKPAARLTQAEWEAVRLHPYHSERILSRVPAWSDAAALAGAHHEWLDGSGYHRGVTGTQIPIGARIVAVAEAYDEYTHDAPGRLAMKPEAALTQIGDEAGTRFDATVVNALAVELGGIRSGSPPTSRQRETPGGLTAREVDVLRLAAKGLTRKQVAHALMISENTVRSHLEHIYSKIGVSTRAAAALFAVEHGLL